MKRTEEWSEQRSSKLVTVVYSPFGIFVMKMSRMSGLFLGEEGQ